METTQTILCPSGLAGTVRGLSVADANTIASATRKKDRVALTAKLLKACWQGTDEPGPYEIEDGAAPNWDAVLQGDIDFVLVMIRVATHGSKYSFKAQCSDQGCREAFEWEIDLVDDLVVQRLSTDARERLRTKNEFAGEVPGSGERVLFKLPVHADIKRQAKQRANSRDQLMTLALRTRILSVEGVENLRTFIEGLSLGQAQAMIELFDEQDCGIDTDIEIECPECMALREVSLPLEREFFFPTLEKKKRRAAKES